MMNVDSFQLLDIGLASFQMSSMLHEWRVTMGISLRLGSAHVQSCITQRHEDNLKTCSVSLGKFSLSFLLLRQAPYAKGSLPENVTIF